VVCKAPFAGPKQVLRYLSRYTHRVAISNRRLIAADDAGVAFRWKDYTARDFVPWRFLDAGYLNARSVSLLPASKNLHITGHVKHWLYHRSIFEEMLSIWPVGDE
jgi:hypothetical protein